MARIGALERDLILATAGMDEKTISRELAIFARKEKDNLIAAGRASKRFTRYVDGVRDAPEEAVRAKRGVIRYEFDSVPEVVKFVLDALFELSPVLSGEYRAAHHLYLDGLPVPNLQNYRPGDEVVILNTVPYSRKIEVGAMRMRVPAGVYEAARQRALKRFGEFVSVERKFLTRPGGYIMKRGASKRMDARGRSTGNEMTYPSLVINGL